MRSNTKSSGGNTGSRGRKTVSAGRGSDGRTSQSRGRKSTAGSSRATAGRKSLRKFADSEEERGPKRGTGTRVAGTRSSERKSSGSRPARPIRHRDNEERSFGSRTSGTRSSERRSSSSKPTERRASSSRPTERRASSSRPTERRASGSKFAEKRGVSERNSDRKFSRGNREKTSESFGFNGGKETLSGRRPSLRREVSGGKIVERRGKVQSYTPDNDNDVRLNKFIANSGICSRREADNYILAGLVTVNGEVVTELGSKVKPGDDVRFNGERLKGEEKVYILMNKPKDFVTTTSDPHAEKTVMDLITGHCSYRVYPVGRLDKATTGVLLLTNDGVLAEQLTHPSFQKKKIYQVTLDKNLKGSDFADLLKGIELEDGFIKADDIAYVDGDKTQLGVEIHSGRNRIIRRMFEHLGYKIKKLDRVYFAGLTKKNLRRGQWRFLTEAEVNMLYMGSYE